MISWWRHPSMSNRCSHKVLISSCHSFKVSSHNKYLWVKRVTMTRRDNCLVTSLHLNWCPRWVKSLTLSLTLRPEWLVLTLPFRKATHFSNSHQNNQTIMGKRTCRLRVLAQRNGVNQCLKLQHLYLKKPLNNPKFKRNKFSWINQLEASSALQLQEKLLRQR